MTPWHYACQAGNEKIFKLILKVAPQAIPNTKNNLQQNILHSAAVGGNQNIIKALLRKWRALMDDEDLYGRNAFHLSCLHNSYLAGKQIQARFPKVTERLDKKGQNFYHYIMMHKDNSKMFLHYMNVDPKSLFAQNNDGQSPLHVVCLQGHVEVFEFVIKYARFLERSKELFTMLDKNNETALHVACHANNFKIVDIFLKSTTPATLLRGETNVLYKACRHGNMLLIKYVCGLKKIEIPKEMVREAINYANRYRHYAVVRYLIKKFVGAPLAGIEDPEVKRTLLQKTLLDEDVLLADAMMCSCPKV